MSAFSIALSGLTAASTDLDVVSNNIANADTVGFKSSRTEFADVYAAGAVNLNQSSVGEGTRVDATSQQFTQGDITTTSANLDLAISGDGFFTLKDPSGTVYSRNGEFSPDKNGNVVNATGQALQVYPPTANGGFNTGTTQDLNLETAQSAPAATTTGTVILNLPAASTPPAIAPFNATNPATYNQSTSTTVYDSLGNASPATFYFTQTAVPNTWTVNMTINGTVVGTPQTLTFSNTGATHRARPAAPWPSAATRRLTARRGSEYEFQFRPEHAIRRRFRRNLDRTERLRHRAAEHGLDRLHGHRLRGLHQRPHHPPRTAGDGELSRSGGPEAIGRHQLGPNLHVRRCHPGHGGLRGLRQRPVERVGKFERGFDHGAREHDHRAARLPGERAVHHHGKSATLKPSSTSRINHG